MTDRIRYAYTDYTKLELDCTHLEVDARWTPVRVLTEALACMVDAVDYPLLDAELIYRDGRTRQSLFPLEDLAAAILQGYLELRD